MRQDIDVKFADWAKEWQQTLTELEKKNRLFSTWRSLAAVAAIALIVAAALTQRHQLWLPGLFFVGIFIFFVSRHQKLRHQMEGFRKRLQILMNYRQRAVGAWKGESEPIIDVETISDETLRYVVHDLDLIGRRSIFSYLCTAHSLFGKIQLLKWLTGFNGSLEYNSDLMNEFTVSTMMWRQAAVRELADNPRLCIEVQTVMRDAAEQSPLFPTELKAGRQPMVRSELQNILQALPQGLTTLRAVGIGLSAVVIVSLVMAIAGLVGPWRILLAVGVILQLLFYSPKISLNPLFSALRYLQKYLASLETLIQLITRESWQTDYLKNISDIFTEAREAIARLNKLSKPVAIRNNGIIGLIVNGLFSWDVHMACYMVREFNQIDQAIDQWFGAAGQVEALVSLATPCFTRKLFCWPNIITAEMPLITTEGVQHLLIAEDHVVGNDLKLNPGIDVITGSNMSGKTTLLRTMGTALILAYAGAPIPAKEFKATKMNVFTSMRVGDDIGRGESTFFAELKRIRGMIEYSRSGQPFLALIDEIFKGTNSADRIVGAQATLRKLAHSQGIVMVSTHDFELCDLEDDPEVVASNHHFVESYPDGRLAFDYKMRPGRCETTNARYLLRLAGILEEEGDHV